MEKLSNGAYLTELEALHAMLTFASLSAQDINAEFLVVAIEEALSVASREIESFKLLRHN